MNDPLDDIEQPSLAEQVEPYRKYGDTELALSLLSFHKPFATSVSALGFDGETAQFDVRARPDDTGANYECQHCNEPVRGVSRPGEDILHCPLCGEFPGALTLRRGMIGDSE